MHNLQAFIVTSFYIFSAVASAAPSYPQCAQICKQSSAFALTNPNSLDQLCSTSFRTATSICQAVTCNDADQRTANSLDQSLCGSSYQSNATLSSAVSSAIASATPIAVEATAGKDETVLSNFPQCAQNCITQNAILSLCGSLSNRTCICTSRDALIPVDTCERTTCDPADITRESALANKLCYPVGGVLANYNGTSGVVLTNGSRISNSTSQITSTPTPSQLVFTGKAADLGGNFWARKGLFLLAWVLFF